VQDFTVKLIHDSENDDLIEYSIKTLKAKTNNDSYTVFDLIFTPNSEVYNKLVFELTRTAIDYREESRFMEVEVLEFYTVNNIISDYLNVAQLKKIGIQGPPGLMFVLDGEEIKLGRTGIYELCNDEIQINYLGFVINESTQTQDGKDFFILDYRY
jgi:hypothetical protein